MRKTITAGLAVGMMAATPAAAQPPFGEDDAPVLEGLVITAPDGGPAWWRVADDDTTIFILILPKVMPASVDWDHRTLDRRLKGASRLITPLGVAVTPSTVIAASRVAAKIPAVARKAKDPPKAKGDKRPLEETLPPDVRVKFVAARQALGKPAEAYANLAADDAARTIQKDFRAKAGMRRDLLGQIRARAKANGVPVQPVAKVSFPAFAKVEVKADPGLGGAECLNYVLDRMGPTVARETAVAKAWAVGDVRPMLAERAKKPEVGCGLGTVGITGKQGKAIMDKVLAEEVATFEKVLKTPGKAVAILKPWDLLSEGGVLDQLRAKGYTISRPDVVSD